MSDDDENILLFYFRKVEYWGIVCDVQAVDSRCLAENYSK